MAALTFLDTLRIEVARMQAAKPEKLGEIARANALILNGQVVPCAEDPQTALVLSSDGKTQYHVNSHCDCEAGQHGRACKHMSGWKLYQHIAKKVEAQGQPEQPYPPTVEPQPLYEAPASVNLKVLVHGHEVQWTLRGHDKAQVFERLASLLSRSDVRPLPAARPA
jgi:hypothetical protein